MKNKSPFKTALTLALSALKGNWLRAAITVLLLTFCATAFGFASTMFIADYTGKQAEIFLSSPLTTLTLLKGDFSESSALSQGFLYSESFPYAEQSAVREYLSGEEIGEISARTGLSFAKLYAPIAYGHHSDTFYSFPEDGYDMGLIASGEFAEWDLFYGDHDRRASVRSYNAQMRALEGRISQMDEVQKDGFFAQMEALAQRTPYSAEYQRKYNNDFFNEEGPLLSKHRVATRFAAYDDTKLRQDLAYLPEELLGAFGFSLLAGHMPQQADEVAIDACFLHEFMARGYYLYEDVAAGEMVVPKYNLPEEPWYDPEEYDGVILNEEEFPAVEEGKIVRVTRAEDLIGKKLALYGNFQTEERFGKYDSKNFGVPKGMFYTVTISGVVDTGCNAAWYLENVDYLNRKLFLQHNIFVSKAWTEIFYPEGEAFAIVTPRPTNKKTVKRVLALHEGNIERYRATEVGETYPSDLILIAEENELTSLINNITGSFRIIQTFSASGGALFAIFGALLCFTLISASVEGKRKQIGVMKAIGARDRDIYKIYLLESLLLGLAIFFLATACVAALCWGWMYPIGLEVRGVPLFDFGILQILCILLVSVGLPMLCAALSVRKFLKYSCVEMIKGKTSGGENGRKKA